MQLKLDKIPHRLYIIVEVIHAISVCITLSYSAFLYPPVTSGGYRNLGQN